MRIRLFPFGLRELGDRRLMGPGKAMKPMGMKGARRPLGGDYPHDVMRWLDDV